MSKIKLPHASGNSMSIAAPATNPASDLELKLPATIGTANQYLKNSSTAGTLEFGTLSAGKVLQLVTARQESVVSWNTTSFTDISGLTATITGVASGSKIIVDFNLNLGRSHDTHAYFNLMRDSTGLEAYSGAGFTFTHYKANASAANDFETVHLRYVDTHGQSAGSDLVYKLQGHNNASTNYVQYLNRRSLDSTQRGGCLMTLTEVSG